MKISEIGEFGLIRRIGEVLGVEFMNDCAWLRTGGGYLLLTVDALVEDVHFLRSYPPEDVGWKAVSVSVSDVVGNGGLPRWVLVSLVLPDTDVEYVEGMYRGIKRACDLYGCEVVGGNVSRGEKVVIDVSVLGESKRPVGRGGARPGDAVFVSGPLGDSRAGLELLLKRRDRYEEFEERLIRRHLKPVVKTEFAKHIQRCANASMDISDGLVSDMSHIANVSGVRIDVESDRIPVSDDLRRYCDKYEKDPLHYALFGGEDYELLFTHPTDRIDPSLPMTRIGEVSEGEGVYVDGRRAGDGFTHF